MMNSESSLSAFNSERDIAREMRWFANPRNAARTRELCDALQIKIHKPSPIDDERLRPIVRHESKCARYVFGAMNLKDAKVET